MRTSTDLNTYRNQIKTIITTHHAKNARVYSYEIRGEDTDNSYSLN
jgi:hypothetical protein